MITVEVIVIHPFSAQTELILRCVNGKRETFLNESEIVLIIELKVKITKKSKLPALLRTKRTVLYHLDKLSNHYEDGMAPGSLPRQQ